MDGAPKGYGGRSPGYTKSAQCDGGYKRFGTVHCGPQMLIPLLVDSATV
jgi:hypothetical protein